MTIVSDKNRMPESSLSKKHYRDLLRKNIIRLFLTYLAPLILFVFFFEYQYATMLRDSSNLHLKSVAESKANIMDLFLRERVVNLINLIDDPNIQLPPGQQLMDTYLDKLKRDSETFIDVGFFDSAGVMKAYSGPVPTLVDKDYSKENWYLNLLKTEQRYVITDIYSGFRQEPHFTIAVKKIVNGRTNVLRATLDPKKIYDFITSNETSQDNLVSIVNIEGYYQLAPAAIGMPLEKSCVSPEFDKHLGTAEDTCFGGYYAYSWLGTVSWAVVVQINPDQDSSNLWSVHTNVMVVSSIILIVLFVVIVTRSRKFIEMEKEKDTARLQLEHASRLASVGELASGIAHEINNPLATIASEAGLMKDLMSPEFSKKTTFKDLEPGLDNIEDAVFRCRDITRKLLSFVRQDEITISDYNVNDIIKDLMQGFFEKRMEVTNIKMELNLDSNVPPIKTDANQMKQVFINLVNNAFDAIDPPGKITIATHYYEDTVSISVSDTGSGIDRESLDKIFLPFFTTKEVGTGTGLGLSVSYSIIKNLGGTIDVESILGKGSTFTIKLPIE